jgi:hypothetical protein
MCATIGVPKAKTKLGSEKKQRNVTHKGYGLQVPNPTKLATIGGARKSYKRKN